MGWVRDESGIIVSWIMRIFVVFALFGVAMYDAGSIVVNHFTLDSKADEIAIEISTEVVVGQTNFNQTGLRNAARTLARDAGARLVSFEISREGTVELSLRRTADTLIVGRLSATEDWAKATAGASIAPAN